MKSRLDMGGFLQEIEGPSVGPLWAVTSTHEPVRSSFSATILWHHWPMKRTDTDVVKSLLDQMFLCLAVVSVCAALLSLVAITLLARGWKLRH